MRAFQTPSRDELRNELKGIQQPIVVAIDDIDRLNKTEIREIFRLVRLTGNFPNVIYLLAFDRARIEAALEDDNLPGKDYLEKIVQFTYDLPNPHREQLSRLFLTELDRLLGQSEIEFHLDRRRWPRVLYDIILPQIRNVRDIHRVSGSMWVTVSLLAEKIDLVDIVALETTRIQNPALFHSLMGNVELLTKPLTTSSGNSDEPSFQAIRNLAQEMDTHESLLSSLLDLIFPAASAKLKGQYMSAGFESEWLAEKRTAHAELLHLYSATSPSYTLSTYWLAGSAIEHLSSSESLESFFRSIEPSMWEDVISALEQYEGSFSPQMAVSTAVTLLNLEPEFPDRQRSMFDSGVHIKLTRVVLRMLRKLSNEGAVLNATREALPRIQSLAGKLSLVQLVGHEEHVGHQLIKMKKLLRSSSGKYVTRSDSQILRHWRRSVRSLV